VAPVAVGILAIEMVVLAWMHHECDLAHVSGTLGLERGSLKVRYIQSHEPRHVLTRPRLGVHELIRESFRAARLVKEGLTALGLAVALCHLIGINDVEAVVPAVVRVLNAGITVVPVRIERGFRSRQGSLATAAMGLTEQAPSVGSSVARLVPVILAATERLV